MKAVSTIVILILTGHQLSAQQVLFAKGSSWLTIDTIEQFSNRSYVEYKSYSDSTLQEQTQAYLYSEIMEVPRFRIFRSWFKDEIRRDSVVYHGERTTYLSIRSYKIEKFDQGKLLTADYFNSNGQRISKKEYQQIDIVIVPCRISGGHYFYYGKIKDE